MMTDKMPRLENWELVMSGDAYTAPELMGALLQGDVYDHPKFLDGKKIHTSQVISSKGRTVKTENTEYILGEPKPEYKKWVEDNLYAWDDDNPVRIKQIEPQEEE